MILFDPMQTPYDLDDEYRLEDGLAITCDEEHLARILDDVDALPTPRELSAARG